MRRSRAWASRPRPPPCCASSRRSTARCCSTSPAAAATAARRCAIPRGEFRVGQRDVLLGEVDGTPFYIGGPQFEDWQPHPAADRRRARTRRRLLARGPAGRPVPHPLAGVRRERAAVARRLPASDRPGRPGLNVARPWRRATGGAKIGHHSSCDVPNDWGGWGRTSNLPVNSRALCQLSYTPLAGLYKRTVRLQ